VWQFSVLQLRESNCHILLQAMGLVFIARPGLMLEMQTSLDVYFTALKQGTQAIKARVLANIVDLLRWVG
jgi:hypothetical protein